MAFHRPPVLLPLPVSYGVPLLCNAAYVYARAPRGGASAPPHTCFCSAWEEDWPRRVPACLDTMGEQHKAKPASYSGLKTLALLPRVT